MDALHGWDDAPAFVLSCPGPMAPDSAAIVPIKQLARFQCLFGQDAQVMAYALATRGEAARTFFCHAPEIFDGVRSREALAAAIGRPAGALRRVVHIRFGPARAARVLKGARNAHALAEDHPAPMAEIGVHPFASGLVLPAAVSRVLYYEPDQGAPRTVLGAELHGSLLPAEAATADLDLALQRVGRTPLLGAGLQIESLADFQPARWRCQPAAEAGPDFADRRMVLVPWNLCHPGSAVPDILVKLARLHASMPSGFAIVLFVFNEAAPGLGAVTTLIDRLRDAAGAGAASVLGRVFVGRLGAIGALPVLLRRFGAAWVDGNDPEHRWTIRRLAALRLRTLLIDPHPSAALPEGCAALTRRIAADEAVRVVAQTEIGRMVALGWSLSWRGVSALVTQSLAALEAAEPRAPATPVVARAPRGPRARRGAA